MIEPKKFTYTIKWTQSPGDWNKVMFENTRLQAHLLEEKYIEQELAKSDLSEAKQVLESIFKK
jgi:hypothetical protein